MLLQIPAMVIIFLMTDNHAELCPFLILRRRNEVSVTHTQNTWSIWVAIQMAFPLQSPLRVMTMK